MGKIRTVILVAVFYFSFLSLGLSETIVLKSGQKIEGRIIEQTDKYVKLEFQGIELIYYGDEIASIEQGSSSTEDVSPQLKALYKAYTSSLKVSQKSVSSESAEMGKPALDGESEFQSDKVEGKAGVSVNSAKPALENKHDVQGGNTVKNDKSKEKSAGVDLTQLPPEYQELIKAALAKQQVLSSKTLADK